MHWSFNLFIRLAVTVILFRRLFCQTTDSTTEKPSNCPDADELAPYCYCAPLSSTVQFLYCSFVQNEDQLEHVFTTAYFPNSSYVLIIKNNRELSFLSRNVFGNISFVTVHIADSVIEYIDQTAFENSYTTLLHWNVVNCNLQPQGFPFSSIESYTSLITLQLNGAGKFDILPRIYSDSIAYLYVENCEVSYLHMEAFHDMQNLTFLYLNDNKITSLAAGQFDNNELIQTIYITNNNLQQLVAGTFRNLEHLWILELGFNQIYTIQPGSFYNLPALERLYLYSNSLPYILAEHLGLLPSLSEFAIFENDIQYIDKDLLIGCSKLNSLSTRNNKITIISEGTFDALESGFIDLSSNFVTKLDQSWLQTPLKMDTFVELSNNPIECDCDVAWLFVNTTLMNKLYASCQNGTDIHDLQSAYFADNC